MGEEGQSVRSAAHRSLRKAQDASFPAPQSHFKKCKPRVTDARGPACRVSRAEGGSTSEHGETSAVLVHSVTTDVFTPWNSMVSRCSTDGQSRMTHHWNPRVGQRGRQPERQPRSAPRTRGASRRLRRKSRTTGSGAARPGSWITCGPRQDRMEEWQLQPATPRTRRRQTRVLSSQHARAEAPMRASRRRANRAAD